MGKVAWPYCICLSRWLIPHGEMFAPNCQLGDRRCNTKNCSSSVDTHFQNAAESVSLQWLCHYLFCLYRLPIYWLRIAITKLQFNFSTYNTKYYWRFIDAQYNILSIQHLLSSIIVFIIIWSQWFPFWKIATWSFGKAEYRNLLVLVTLIRLKFIHPGK